MSSTPAMSAAISRIRRSARSEEHTSELQSRLHLVCRLLLEKKKQTSDVLAQLDPDPRREAEAQPGDGRLAPGSCGDLLAAEGGPVALERPGQAQAPGHASHC